MSISFVTIFIALCDGGYSLTYPHVKEGFYQNCISTLISIEVCVFKIGTDWYLFKIKVSLIFIIFTVHRDISTLNQPISNFGLVLKGLIIS